MAMGIKVSGGSRLLNRLFSRFWPRQCQIGVERAERSALVNAFCEKPGLGAVSDQQHRDGHGGPADPFQVRMSVFARVKGRSSGSSGHSSSRRPG